MNRRKFLQQSSWASLPLLLQGIPLRSLAFQPFQQTATDRVLVLIQLFGGNDGLNTVIPAGQYEAYLNARSGLAIPEKKCISLSGISDWSLHPAMTGMQELFTQHKMSIIQSVGYANPDFSHFRSTDIWMSGADADQPALTGWAGRYLDQQFPGFPAGYPSNVQTDPPAVQTGTAASLVFQGSRSPLGITIENPEHAFEVGDGLTGALPSGNSGDALQFVRQVADQTRSYGDIIRKAAGRIVHQQEYPAGNKLADQLKLVAKLIAGGLKTKMYMVSLDGFDTHAEQVVAGSPETGRHADLLSTLSEAVFAFQQDLQFLGLEEKVISMTFSEFGRRIKSNNSRGTDHGAAAPVFVIGAGVKGGLVGQGPVLPATAAVDDNLAMKTDFRSVYSSVLQQWFNAPAAAVQQWLGKNYSTLPLLKQQG